MIYIECGAHSGARIRRVLKEKPEIKKVYGFECNKDLFPKLETLPKPLVEIIPKAAWTENGQISFFLGKNPDTSSVWQHKKPGRVSETPIYVDSIDFCEWLMQKFEKGKEYLFVRMNMEGSEYPVLQKMLQTGAIDWVNWLEVELHAAVFHVDGMGTPAAELVLLKQLKDKLGDSFHYFRDAGGSQEGTG